MKKKILILSLSLILTQELALAQTHIWTGAGGDLEWFTPTNWDVGTVPIANSQVLIPSGFIVEITAQQAESQDIELQTTAQLHIGNNLAISGNTIVSPTATFLFKKGMITGGGTIINNGQFLIETLENKDLEAITIVNDNIISINDSGVIHLNNDVNIINAQGAEINILSNGGLLENGNTNAVLNNNGLLRKLPNANGSFGSFYLVLDVNNTGTMDVGENQTFLLLGSSENFINNLPGVMQGNGTFDITANFTNTGFINAGNDGTVGSLEIVNNAELMAPGKIFVDIDGPSDYDTIEIFGSPDLEGDIIVNMISEANLGDEFTVLTATLGINSCNFPKTIIAPYGPITYFFNLICNPNSIVLKVDEVIILSTDEFETLDSNFYVYPNPVNDTAIINFKTSDSAEHLSVSVYNTLGQEVRVIEDVSETNNLFEKQNLSKGLYFLRLISQEHILATTKVIIK